MTLDRLRRPEDNCRHLLVGPTYCCLTVELVDGNNSHLDERDRVGNVHVGAVAARISLP